MRALLVIVLVPLVASATPTSVALELTSLDEASFAALDGVGLEKSATVRLVQEGFAVVARTAQPQVTLSLAVVGEPRSISLLAHGPGGDVTREVPWGAEPLVELHLEVTQKLVELTRAVSKAAAMAPPAAEPSREWGVTGSLGVLIRPGGADPLGVVSARWGSRFRVAAELGLSGGRGVQLVVFESHLQLGPAVSFPLTDKLVLELALMGGVLLHSFTLANTAATDAAGLRFNALVTAPVSMSYALTDALHVGFRLVAGWGLGREHLNGTEILWSRGQPRVEAAVSVQWRL